MTAKTLSGKEVAEALTLAAAAKVDELKSKGITPTLAILRVGENGSDISYEKGATKRAAKAGVEVKNVILPENVDQETLLAEVKKLNEDSSVHGVLMFRPLPKHIDEDLVRNTLDPAKDVDCITDMSLAGVFTGQSTGFAPCTPQACIEILDHYGVECQGKHAVVVGRSLVVGKPVSMMLLGKNATVTTAHSRTQNLPALLREADIVVACVGRPKMVDAVCFKPGQVVIDVGINVVEGKLVGDVDYDAALDVVDAITPVPGGVGSVTSSVLIKHVVEACERQTA